MALDGIDLKILNMLARDGRVSYRSIGAVIGLTTKSVKSRVDKMLSAGIIDKFIAVVNPAVFGYSRTYAVALRKSMLSKEMAERIALVGVVGYRFEVLGGAVGFGVGVREEDEDKARMLLESLAPAIVGVIESRNREVTDDLTRTDYAILKELVKKPRMEITDIAKATSTSPKTVRRRMEKMAKNRVVEFSIHVNPSAMKGQIVFFLSVRAEKQFYSALLEKIYRELDENIIMSTNMSNQVDAIGLNMASDDVFKIEGIRARIESLDGVREASVFFPIKLEYPQDWVIKAIDRKLRGPAEGRFAQIAVSK